MSISIILCISRVGVIVCTSRCRRDKSLTSRCEGYVRQGARAVLSQVSVQGLLCPRVTGYMVVTRVTPSCEMTMCPSVNLLESDIVFQFLRAN